MPKNYLKKTLAGIFAVALVASAVPLAPYTKMLDSISITASAAAAPASYFDYKIENGEAIITSYNGPDNIDLEIPSEIEGKPVTKLAWYLDTHFLNKIIVPDTVKTIEGAGFFGETSGTGGAEEIVIPASVTSIVAWAFDYLVNPVVYYGGSKERWQEINEDESVTELRMHYYDGTLQGFSYTYDDATEGLKITGYSGTDTDVVIPAEIAGAPVTIIGYGAFDQNNSITSVTIPDTVTSIGEIAFNCCYSLGEITIPDTVTSIGDNAFNSCYHLKKVTLPDSVTSIGKSAFECCDGLTEITIPDFVTSISDSIFYCCENLKSIIIPDSVTRIGNRAFHECTSLENVYYTGSESDWESVSIENGNDALNNATITYNYGVRNTIPNSTLTWEIDENGVLTISGDDEAFPDFIDEVTPIPIAWCDRKDEVKEVVFNTPNLTSIGRGAFGEFSNLESIKLPNSLIMIGDIAFVCCTSLEKIEFPNTLTTIGDSAFYGCEKLESIELPDSLTTLGGGAFDYCEALKSIKLSAAMTSIPGCAFMYAAIESVTIPAGITEISDFAFGGCPNLKAINVEADNSNYCSVDGVLFNKDKTALMQYPIGKEDAAYTVPDTVTSILGGAFCYAESLTDITLPDFLTTIEEEAFSGTKIKSITIPDTVTKINSWTFGECEDLTSVIIPDSVTEIGSYAFENCSSLADVTLSDSLKNIGEYAFAECPLLTDITIPASVTNVGESVFVGSGLKSATFECDDADAIANFNPDEGRYIFNGCTDLETIYVPAGCADSYKNSDGYKAALGDYIDLIQEMPTAEAKGYSVSYNGDITINFHYLVSDSCKNGYIKFSDNTQVSASDAVKDANGYFVFPISMLAKNMYDEITAQFYDENDVAIGNAVTFDLETYMDKVKAYDPNYSDFVDSFLEYGKQAAAYFGVTGAPAGKTYSDSDFASISNTLEANYASTDNMGDTFVGATLLLKSTPKLRLYYSETFTGAEQNELNKNLFYTEKEISPVKFGTEDLNGYYVYNYIYKAMNSDDSGLKALCAALYNMSKAIPAVG